MFFIVSFALGLHILVQPFRHQLANRLETSLLFVLLVFSTLNISAAQAMSDGMAPNPAIAVAVASILSIVLVFGVVIVVALKWRARTWCKSLSDSAASARLRTASSSSVNTINVNEPALVVPLLHE